MGFALPPFFWGGACPPHVAPSCFGMAEATLGRAPLVSHKHHPKISWGGSPGGTNGDRATYGAPPHAPQNWDGALPSYNCPPTLFPVLGTSSRAL